jgi:hypothetical protein
MEVKVKISGYDEMEAATIAAVVSPWIKNFAAQCGVNDQNVEQFVIADESHYAAAIQTISKSELFTNTNSLLGVGKTIVARDERDTVRCDVVVRAEIASMMVEGVESGKAMDQWQLNSQIGAYVVAHELGHCRDYCERLDDADNAPLDTSTFRIAHFAKYYGRIAASEYAASHFSSFFVTQPLFDQFIVDDLNTVGSAVEEAHELRRKYRRTDELFQLACTAASAYWLAIIQAAKLFGIRKGNPALRDIPLNWSKWFLSNGGGTMDALEKRLSVLWDEYPHLDADFLEACQECWAALALEDGFKFSPNRENDANTGDGLYFDTVSLHDLIRRTRR